MKSARLWRVAAVVVVLGLVACRPGEDADSSAAAEDAAMNETTGEEAGAEQTPEVTQPKNWMLITFVEPIQETDLEWLKQNGFHVDTVFSETMLRGWLEVLEGGEVIGTDPRIAKIDAMMR